MSLSLHTIQPSQGSKTKKRRVGRGGKRGSYSGKGLKGQNARSGASGMRRRAIRHLMESTPKLRGFKSQKPRPEIVNLGELNDKLKTGDTVTPKFLFDKKLINHTKTGAKILGNGDIKIKLEISDCQVSASAKEKIEKAGGKVNEIVKPEKKSKKKNNKQNK